jgi:hypothetical protein
MCSIVYNIIVVCNTCLKELKISQKDFYPKDIDRTIREAPGAEGWDIPPFVLYHEEKNRYYDTPTSSVVCLCLGCSK